MKITATVGESEIMFDSIKIKTKNRTFDFVNATMSASIMEVLRYYDMEDWESIEMKQRQPRQLTHTSEK